MKGCHRNLGCGLFHNKNRLLRKPGSDGNITYCQELLGQCCGDPRARAHQIQASSRCPECHKRRLQSQEQWHFHPRINPKRWGIKTTGRRSRHQLLSMYEKLRGLARRHVCERSRSRSMLPKGRQPSQTQRKPTEGYINTNAWRYNKAL